MVHCFTPTRRVGDGALLHTYRKSEGRSARVSGQVQRSRCQGGGGTPEDDSGHQQLARIDTVDQEARGELEGKGR